MWVLFIFVPSAHALADPPTNCFYALADLPIEFPTVTLIAHPWIVHTVTLW